MRKALTLPADILRRLGRRLYYGPKTAVGRLFFNSDSVLNEGERYDPFLTSFSHRDRCHIPRYKFALQHISKGDEVTDIACGTGYGTAMIAESCTAVTGIDISEQAIDYAKEKYLRDNIRFVISDFFENYVTSDIIVSFETIEHIKTSNLDNVLEKLVSLSRFKIVGSVPYKETPGNNMHHFHFNLDESSLQYLFALGRIEFHYQTSCGTIYSRKPSELIQNLIFVFEKK